MQKLEMYFQQHPGTREATELKAKMVPLGAPVTNYRLQSIVTVPVVVHIILSNPYIVTDADVQAQINRLNLDYSGFNPDSTNASLFYAVKGHSQIQFCLAKRTPSGQLTNGIERRSSSTGSNIGLSPNPIKRSASGGLDVWDPSSYLNLWIGDDASGQGLLGYAAFPGAGDAADDGVWINYKGFGSNSCYTYSAYDLGRTATHEIGHYFGLFHIWGDESGCTGDDFRQLPAGSCTLPSGLFNPAGQGNTASDIGDTPNQADATTNCPSGMVTDACATTAPGKMYQDYMDYTADACYSMFTAKQVQRMEWVLDSCRSGLKTSLGCQPPAGALSLDVAPFQSVNPGGFELAGCGLTSYPSNLSCPGSFIPKFRIINDGLTTLTSVTAGYELDNGAAVTQTVTVNLAVKATAVISFPPTTVAIGSHQLKFFTSNPNGSADQAPGNDTLLQNFSVMGATSLPVTEGFEGPFPPGAWSVINPDGDFTWQKTTPGHNSPSSMYIDNYDVNGTNHIDDFKSQSISTTGVTTLNISFDLAHKNYPQTGYSDTLSVLISNDCGATYQTVYKKWGAALATAGSSSSGYTNPAASDWRTEVINVSGPILSSGQVIVVFRNTSRNGNNIFIDNINIQNQGQRDLKLLSINAPGNNACNPQIVPQVTVLNNGAEDITSFKVGYRIDNGTNIIQTFNQTIISGDTAMITLPAITAAYGSRIITAFTADPVSAAGSGDLQPANDTLVKNFTVVSLINPPVIEGFENAFPPANWAVINPDNNVTWVKKAPGKNSSYAAFFDNYDNDVKNQTDDLRSPFINVSGADSLIIQFDVAHKNYPTNSDTLTVLLSSDCGNTYTSVYKKWGSALATAGSATSGYLTPLSTDWRNERIGLDNSFSASGSVNVLFRNTNEYGNNIFLDNVNIQSLYKRDAGLVSISQPTSLVCSGNFSPTATIHNMGIETITGLTISFSIDSGAVQTTSLTNINLVRNADTTISLSAVNLGVGAHSIKIYTWKPISASGSGDQYTVNDSLVKKFSVAGNVQAPLTETFAGNIFPPANWSVINPDGEITWNWYATGNGTPGSAYLNSFNYAVQGQTDDLVSPVVNYPTVDSVKLTFDLAASTYTGPGSPGVPLDTLEVLISKDCGNSFTTVYKKWGEDLQTVTDPNFVRTTQFFPQSAGQWRKETIDLSQFANQSPVQVFFRVISNYENNIFIDNVNLTTRILPAKLKQQGYLVLPTPFHNSFGVWHYQTPTTLKYLSVYNLAGQLVWTKNYNGDAQKMETIDLTGKAAGMYIVKIGYQDANRNVSVPVVKY